MIRKTALAASIAALLTPAVAGALGLGNIEVSSGLNEPLQARIPLRGVESGELESLRAGIGTEEQFRRAGLERAFVLTKLRFELVETSATSGFIRVTSRDPIAEPFLNFLVDVNWPRGRVLREYTVLLDPPVYGAAISSATRRAVPSVQTLPEVSSQTPGPARSAPGPARSTPPVLVASRAPRIGADSYGPVREGETLWSIADRARPAGVSIQNMMLALLRANPQAFSLDNVNALRTGAVLRIPSASEIAGDQAQALATVARQQALWEEYRQSLPASVGVQPGGIAVPAAAAPPPPPSPAPEAAPGPAAAGAAPAPAELRVVGGTTAGAVTGAGASDDAQTLRNELSLAQEEAEAARLENQELTSRLRDVEVLIGDLRRLVELKEDQLAALQQQLSQVPAAGVSAPGEAPAAETSLAPQPVEQVTPVTAPVSETPAAEPAPVEQATPATTLASETPAAAPPAPRPVPPPPPPKSFLDQVNEMLPVPLWSVLAGLGALLFALGGLRWARGRAAQKDEIAAGGAVAVAVVPAVAAGGSMSEQYAPTELPAAAHAREARQEDVTEMPSSASPDAATVVNEDASTTERARGDTGRLAAASLAAEEDPLAEVNVYLAYERFDQAEQLVRNAISNYPQRHEYKLKLLEVYYAAKNVAGFEIAARGLHDAVGDEHELMQQAQAWWRDLGADHALFEGADLVSTQRTTAMPEDDVFDVTASESGEGAGVDFDLGFESADGAAASSLDFDLGADDRADGEADSSLDFDLGSLGVGDDGTLGKPPAGTAVDFDFTADAESPFDDSAATGLDFDLDGLDTAAEPDHTRSAPLPARAGASTDTGLDFDLDGLDAGSDAQTMVGDAPGDDDAPLDFMLDDAEPRAQAGAGVDPGDEDNEFDFELGDTSTLGPVAQPRYDEREDFALSLDADASDDAARSPDLSGQTTVAGGMQADDDGATLDFDLSEDADSDRDSASARGQASGLDLELQSGDEAWRDAPSSLDMDLGEQAGSDTFQDSRTEISDGTEFGLGSGSDDATMVGTGSSDEVDFPLLDMGDDEPLGNIETVQLPAQDAQALRGRAGIGQRADANDDSFGVDSEFRDIFAAGDDDRDGTGAASVLDFDLGTDLSGHGQVAGDDGDDTAFTLADLPPEEDEDDHLVLGRGESGEVDELQTKLDLAQAYMDMGDTEGARNLLDEVMAQGGDAQKDQAREMLTRLS